MLANQSRSNLNRKSKTSVLFQVRQNYQQNIQVGQSMNIISLRVPSKCIKRNGSDSTSKNQNNQSFNNNNRIYARRANQSAKLTIKLSSGGFIGDQENRYASLHQVPGAQKKLDLSDIVDKFQRKHLITVQKNKVCADLVNFQNICGEFVMRIQDLQYQNNELNGRMKKFQSYFKQLKAKDPLSAQTMEGFFQESSQKNDKNAQLKILNLEKKVETLNYIIKNYRSNNKQELKQFEKKVNEYKPNIEQELTKILAQANKKVQQLSNLVEYFEKQCKKYTRDGNWVQIVRSLQTKDENIERLQQQVKELRQENAQLKQQSENGKIFKQEAQKLNKEVMVLSAQLTELRKISKKLQEEKTNKEIDYEELNRAHQELTYKYEGLVYLESKMKEKDQIIRRNSQAINRIQNENSILKSKIGAMVKNSNAQLFDKQAGPIEMIQKCSATIQQLADRFCEQIERLPEVNKELTSFIMHLYGKTKNSFQKIVEQYRQQLQQSCFENRQLKNRLNILVQMNSRKYACANDLILQMQNIESKRKRCLQSQSRIQNKSQCPSCINWILHWGQMNNLYAQLQECVKKLREIQN